MINNYKKFINESKINKKTFDEYIDEFGFFITLNLSQVTKTGKDSNSSDELSNMMKNVRKPLINGLSFFDIINDRNILYNNPKIISIFLNQTRKLLEYIEPRIIKFVKEDDIKDKWLIKIDKLKSMYKNIINTLS